MLVLAGIETIFFIVSGMGLCFGFGLKTALTIEMFLLIVSKGGGAQAPGRGHSWGSRPQLT